MLTFAPLYYGNEGGFLAQLVEQWIENPCVPGSIPGETTFKSPAVLQVIFLWLDLKKTASPLSKAVVIYFN